MGSHIGRVQGSRCLYDSPRGSVDPSEGLASRGLALSRSDLLQRDLPLGLGEEGQDITEYALLAALIAVVVSGIVIAFGGSLQGWWTAISSEIDQVLAL